MLYEVITPETNVLDGQVIAPQIFPGQAFKNEPNITFKSSMDSIECIHYPIHLTGVINFDNLSYNFV